MKRIAAFAALAATALGVAVAATSPDVDVAKSRAPTTNGDAPPPAQDVGHPTFCSPHASPLALHGGLVFVANTPADTLDVIEAGARSLRARISVGVDPVSVAIRPDGLEVWVSNHVSDSVSVVDNDPTSPTYLHVVATVQDFRGRATNFDEPVGIAFASNEKAYVALSSENQIAVVDVAGRQVTKRLTIPAQDPRALLVQGDRLYVLPFESNNQTQLSGGDEIDGDLTTFNAYEHSIRVNNVLSLGHVVDVVKHPDVPDHDLFVFDTNTDELIEQVDGLGSLLYGAAAASDGTLFVTQTDARNDVNGRAGTQKHGLAELENRAFLNRVTRVKFRKGVAESPEFFDLEPLPPQHPAPGKALATPFAIDVSDDGATLVATAAGSDKLFTMDAASGEVLGRVHVDAVPRGVVLQCDDAGAANQAWVLNAVANTVSLVDLTDPAHPEVLDVVTLADPTHPLVKQGRIAFNSAAASTTGTYSCASCHPDGHTDQLLWVLQTPIVSGGDQIMPRSTMPIRGLRDTEPYHWDGVPGDPYGGPNSANIHGSVPPNSRLGDPTSSTRNLIDGGLAATMKRVDDESVNDEGLPGRLSAAERDAMATFLLSVPYPPAQRRAYDDALSESAQQGFRLFHIDGDDDPSKSEPNVCGDCHRMPFWVSTNTPGTGMDAPTWRGAYDRWLILPQGRLNIIDFDFFRDVAERGLPERNIWQFSWAGRRRFDPVWDMVLEGGTGYSGAFARQTTLNQDTARQERAIDLLAALEVAAREGAVVLEAEGVLQSAGAAAPIRLQFCADWNGGSYVEKSDSRRDYSRAELVALAAQGEFVGTFSARHGPHDDVDHPQPAIWTLGPIEQQRGRQKFPVLTPDEPVMQVSGRHLRADAALFVDGRRVPGALTFGEDETLEIKFEELPADGLHFLQVQNAGGLFSNDFLFHVAPNGESAEALRRGSPSGAFADARRELGTALRAKLGEFVAGGKLTEKDAAEVMSLVFPPAELSNAAAAGDFGAVKRLIEAGVDLDARNAASGTTPLVSAVAVGDARMAKYLIRRGANVEAPNAKGNTPLHVAAFFCRLECIEVLLENGASITTPNQQGQTPLDVVADPWSRDLAELYDFFQQALAIDLDLTTIEQTRPRVAAMLREFAAPRHAEHGDSDEDD